jgi:hypothetical protein
MNITGYSACLLTVLALGAGRSFAQDTLVEPSTEKQFPTTVTFEHDGTSYTLEASGATVRKKFFIKVYAVVHYVEGTLQGTVEERIEEVLKDGRAKQLTLDFARDVGQTQIQDAFRDGFKTNATDAEAAGITSTVDSFLAYFDREVKENDQLVFRWLPGGVVLTEAYGEPRPPLKDPLFARVLWTIWFGEDSIVDPEELVMRVEPE